MDFAFPVTYNQEGAVLLLFFPACILMLKELFLIKFSIHWEVYRITLEKNSHIKVNMNRQRN